MSVLRLLVDKGQGLLSRILCYTSVVLPPKGMLSRGFKNCGMDAIILTALLRQIHILRVYYGTI